MNSFVINLLKTRRLFEIKVIRYVRQKRLSIDIIKDENFINNNKQKFDQLLNDHQQQHQHQHHSSSSSSSSSSLLSV